MQLLYIAQRLVSFRSLLKSVICMRRVEDDVRRARIVLSLSIFPVPSFLFFYNDDIQKTKDIKMDPVFFLGYSSLLNKWSPCLPSFPL